MKLFALVLTVGVLATGVSHSGDDLAPSEPKTAATSGPRKRLRAFKSERELKSFFRTLRKRSKSSGYGYGSGSGNGSGDLSSSVMMSGAPIPMTVSATPSPSEESVTNVQHAGVDEGGIVKLRGDHLIILRRGRLFTVSIKDRDMRPVSSIDAFDPEINPTGTWYDEMLVSADTIAVIGYSYDRIGTEIGLFNIDDEGRLRYRSTYHLRSNDYYSSRNYASRLVGRKLIFYSPLDLSFETDKLADSLPALRKWHKDVKDDDFDRIVPATRIYRGHQRLDDNVHDLALHTVTVCDISNGEMSCEATSVLGPSGNVFYVSPSSVYVWASSWFGNQARPMLYQLPLDGSAPAALQVSGSAVDQFSFLESEDGHLNVLVRSEAKGDGMWAAETAEGDVALMRVPLTSFSDGATAVPASQYRDLPKPPGSTFQNRFVGEYILYGTGSGWDAPKNKNSGTLYATRWNGRAAGIWTLPLVHGVDRIEPLGTHSIVVGTDGKHLHFTSIRLQEGPAVAGRYTFQNASQGELRSHGFFYKPADQNSGILGLPVRGAASPGYEHLFRHSASILFLRNRSLQLSRVGELRAEATGAVNDACKASCVDWYGNARPLFVGGRVFALLGYELVEGSLEGDGITEVRRSNFAPDMRNVEGR